MREFGELRGTAEAAADAGAAALRPFLDGRRALDVSPKSRHDFVTAADVASERAVAAAIRAAHPDHRILGEEESRASLDDPGFVWIVDPLDGTTNFIHGYPVFAVSVAVARDGEVVAGVVVDVPRGEVYAAARGEGATQGGTPIRVSSRPGIADALIGTGFPFRKQDRLDKYLASFRAVVADTAGIRRAGSAALDLCAVAAGRFDGFWEEGLGPWDMAAGALLVEEAGGVVTDMRGGRRFLASGAIVCGAPAVHRELLGLVRPHLGD